MKRHLSIFFGILLFTIVFALGAVNAERKSSSGRDQNVYEPIKIAADMPKIEPGVSHELAKWRAAHYSDVRYKLDLTLEKMSPVLKGSIEIRVKVGTPTGAPSMTGAQASSLQSAQGAETIPIILDWRKIKGHEEKSTISNVFVNGKPVSLSTNRPPTDAGGSEFNEHLLFHEGVVEGENVIKIDFTSPILTSGSAITRYIDKEDGSEYIYSLFVPSDASTAFPVFDQPDLKARFELTAVVPTDWKVISNSETEIFKISDGGGLRGTKRVNYPAGFKQSKPISTYVFAFAAGPFERMSEPPASAGGRTATGGNFAPTANRPAANAAGSDIYVRRSQAEKFKPHAAEVFRLNREGISFLEQYFDYKFPFPKYDLVLLPEFPFGGMEHAGATFLREDRIIFPQEPTQNDYITRANLIFHEAAHQWFGDTVTMKWFDDLWLKEGFAEFMAYKMLEKVMPEANAWKVFYERNKQAAYATDSTKGTTPIYQKIDNLSAAKSAYGNIVYRKAPSFLKQAEFYLGAENFQTAARSFLKKHEFGNATWEDLVKEFEDIAFAERIRGWSHFSKMTEPERNEFETIYRNQIRNFTKTWVHSRGLPLIRGYVHRLDDGYAKGYRFKQENLQGESTVWDMAFTAIEVVNDSGKTNEMTFIRFSNEVLTYKYHNSYDNNLFVFPNYKDYGYGIFLLDDKSRNYVIKNIHNEKDDFLRAMMWGSLWDSVREGELDPREYAELVVKNLSTTPAKDAVARASARANTKPEARETDETTTSLLLSRLATTLDYYIDDSVSSPTENTGGNPSRSEGVENAERGMRNVELKNALANARAKASDDLRQRAEDMLTDRMQNAPTLGQRITFFRAFLNIAESEKARTTLKQLLKQSEPPALVGGLTSQGSATARPTNRPTARVAGSDLPLKTKDRFDIVMRLLILNDADAPKLLAELEKTETTDEAKRYAYAARAAIATKENKATYWNDFLTNKSIPESWIEAAFVPFNDIRHREMTLPYLEKALSELPNHKANRKIFFVNGWLRAFVGGHNSQPALDIVNKFLKDNPNLDNDLRLKILENADIIERSVNIRK